MSLRRSRRWVENGAGSPRRLNSVYTMFLVLFGLGTPLFGQTKPAADTGSETKSAAPARQVGDLITRFRFIEKYAPSVDAAKPRDVTQYRVASRDVLKMMREKPQGTPDRQESTVQVIYVERPAVLSASGAVTDAVRKYEALRSTPAPGNEAKAGTPRPLEGLTLWYKSKPGGSPLIMALSEGRRLRETEYAINAKLVFFPDLAMILPSLPSRVGDRWPLSKAAAAVLYGEAPRQQSEKLMATLEDVRKSASGTDLVAVIGVKGHAILPAMGDTFLNAQILFTFAAPSDTASGTDGTVDAKGAVTDLRLSRSSSSPLTGGSGRLKQSFTWERTLQRRLGTNGSPLSLPSPPPSPNQANSWLTYDDPEGRFHFRHPQDFLPRFDPYEAAGDDDSVMLVDMNAAAEAGTVISLGLLPKTGDAAVDRKSRDPEFHIQRLKDEWKKRKEDVLPGPTGWLPEADWAASKMKVYRIEAALKPDDPRAKDFKRFFLDYYLVLFGQNECLEVTSTTGQDPPLLFRKQVEEVVKTFKLRPSNAKEGQ